VAANRELSHGDVAPAPDLPDAASGDAARRFVCLTRHNYEYSADLAAGKQIWEAGGMRKNYV
jgi:hypothetical protein